MTPPPLVVVMGVSGSGKSTVGRLLAQRLGVAFADGDDFHADAAIAKMRAGLPLDDGDRAPWLDRIADWLREQTLAGGVASCSALRRTYRDRLRAGAGAPLRLVFLDPPIVSLRARAAGRRGHFMPASLLDSQLATLEPPAADEDAIRLADDAVPDAVAFAAACRLAC